MTTLADAAAGFLAARRIAVTGVSRHPENHGGNVVYKRLRDRGYEVYAVNPNTTVVEGDPSFPDLTSLPVPVDAVVVATAPPHALATMKECVTLGIEQVWLHRFLGAGSVDEEAVLLGREHGLTVIDGGCPLMFGPASDPGHRVMRSVCRLAGHLPRKV
jgi:predicted CoA-binding protein